MADGMKFTFPKLNKNNYVSWKFLMKTLLEHEQAWDVVSKPKPEGQNAQQLVQWKNLDCKARTSIVQGIELNQLRFVKKAETAREMWLNLQTYHEKATAGNQATLLDHLCMLKLSEGEDIEQHLDVMEDMFERLEQAGLEFQEPLRIAMTLRSLPRSYRSFVTSLENRKPEDLTMDFVVGRLRDEFQKCESQEEIYVKQEKALKVKSEEVKKCYFCQKPGHFRANCPEMKKWRDSKAEEEQQDEADVSSRTVCFVAGDGFVGDWIVDSGSSCHMTNDRSFFKVFKRETDTDVTLADGTKTKATGSGSGVIFGIDGKGKRICITLMNVLFVPALEGGLISVRKLMLKGYEVVFKADLCRVQTRDGVVVAVAEARGNQYVMKTAIKATERPHVVKDVSTSVSTLKARPHVECEICFLVGSDGQEESKTPGKHEGKLVKTVAYGEERGPEEDIGRLRSGRETKGSRKVRSYLIEDGGPTIIVKAGCICSDDKRTKKWCPTDGKKAASIPSSQLGPLLLEMLMEHAEQSIRISSQSGGVLS